MAAGLARWLAEQSKNVKVQEFRQGLDFDQSRLGGGLAAGTYVIAQIPLDSVRDMDWSHWRVDPNTLSLVSRDGVSDVLSFNHVMLGLNPM